MKTLKKALALLLVLSMSLSLMSVAAFADGEIIDEPATVEESAAVEETTAEETSSESNVTNETTEAVSAEPETVEQAAEESPEEPAETADEVAEESTDEVEETIDEVEEPTEAETPEETAKTPAEEIVEELPVPVEQPVLTEEELAAQAEAERLAAEEAARLEAERLAAEEAARLEAERLAALERRWPKSDKELVFDTESYRVTVTVPENAFADHVYFRVIEMQWAELDEATAELLKASGLTEDDALLDIGFEDADGFEVEPDAAIGVSIEAAETEIAEVYHVEDAETVTQVAENVAEFEVGSFSLFVVKAGATVSVTYHDTAYSTIAEAVGAIGNDTAPVIHVGTGIYDLPAATVLPAGTTLEGEGADKTTLKITTSNGDGVKITNPNVTIKNATIDGSAITSDGHKSLINVEADGVEIDSVVMTGGGMSTWNSSILVETLATETTFTVKNSVISGSFRGVLRESCNANIVIQYCDIDAVYPFNIDGGSKGTVTVTGGALHGWTSYSGVDSVTFTNVEFSKAKSGYDWLAAYEDTIFNNCTFDTNFGVQASAKIKGQDPDFTWTFTGCHKNEVHVTDQNFKELFLSDSDVWNKCTLIVDGVQVVPDWAVASIGTGAEVKFYKTLADAIAAVPTDGTVNSTTITLLKDYTNPVSFNTNGKSFTLDLNTKTLTFGAGNNHVDKNSVVTICNGNLVFAEDIGGDCFIGIGAYNGSVNELTLDHIKLTGDGYSSAYAVLDVYDGDNRLTIKDSEVTLKNEKSNLGGAFKASTGTTAKIEIINSKIDLEDVVRGFIYADVTITDSAVTIKGGDNGINQSKLTIDHSNIAISGGSGRGITLYGQPVVIKNGSVVTISNMSEGDVLFKDDKNITIQDSSSLTAKTRSGNGSGSIIAPTGYTLVTTNNNDGSKTYTVTKQYTVKFVNWDNKVLQSGFVAQGMTPVYTGIPTRDAVDGTTYTFTGWQLDGNTSYAKGTALPAVTGDVTYTAKFAEVKQAEAGDATVTTDTFVETKTETIEGLGEVDNVKTETTVTTETTTATVGDVTTVTDNQTTVSEKSVPATVTKADSTTEPVVAQVILEVTKTQTVTTNGDTGSPTTTASAKVTVNAAKETVTGTVSNTIDLNKIKLAEIPAVTAAFNMAKAANTVDTTPVEITVKLDAAENTTKTTADVVAFDVKPTVQVGSGTATQIPNEQLSGSILVRLPANGLGVGEDGKVKIRHSSEGYEHVFETTVYGDAGNLYVEFEVDHFSTFELIPASKVLVSFDSNGGSAVASQAVTSGATATQPTTTPTRSGYTFNGWTLGGSAYNFATLVNSDITLVASWTQNSSRSSSRSSRSSSSSTTAPQTTTIVDETTPLSEFPIFYVDVADNSWYHDAIAYVTALELMNGVGDNHFAPNDNTTRGMVAVVMMRLAKGEATDLDSFFDVADSAYYAEAAAWAVENGVFKGYDDGSFRGEINITREQFAAVLYRYALAKGYDVSAKADLGTYDDGALVGGYASDAMAWAIANGIIKGVGNNRLDPLGNATRAQLATMLMRFDELTKDVV